MKQYERRKVWVSRVVESRVPFRINNPLLASIVKFGLVIDLIFLYSYVVRHRYVAIGFLFGYLCALVWLNLGPYFIWYYDEKLLPEFFCKALEIVPDQERMGMLLQQCSEFLSQRFWGMAVPWTVLVGLIYVNSSSVVAGQSGIILGNKDFLYWVLLLVVLWVAFSTSIGFMGVLTTILAVRGISKESLRIDPLHPDKTGGLSSVGHYAMRTAFLFSSGSLFLPFGFQLVFGSRAAVLFSYFATFLMSISVLLSFLYPTITIYRKAKDTRDNILHELRKKQAELSRKLDTNCQDPLDRIAYCLELNRLRNEYFDYRAVNLFPLDTEIFAKLTGSVALPLIIALIQVYFGL